MSETGETLKTSEADRKRAEQAWESYQASARKAAGEKVKWIARPAFIAGWRAAEREIEHQSSEAAKWREAAIDIQRKHNNAQAEIARLKSRPSSTAAPPAEQPQEGGGPHRHSRKPDPSDTADQRLDIDLPASGPDAVARAQEIIGPIQLIPGDGYGERKNAIRDAIAAALTAAEKRGAEREKHRCVDLVNNWPRSVPIDHGLIRALKNDDTD